jgi:hypothetical protein
MTDIRLQKISIEDTSNPLIVQYSTVSLTNTTVSNNSATGSLVSFGGVGIRCSTDSTSILNGGALTIAGGISVYKSSYFGNTITLDDANGSFTIKGITQNRLFVNGVSDNVISMAPNGLHKSFELSNTQLILYCTTDSVNSSTGAMVLNGGLSISYTSDAINPSHGGSLTTAGGVGIGGKLFVSKDSSFDSKLGIGTRSPSQNLTVVEKSNTGSHTAIRIQDSSTNPTYQSGLDWHTQNETQDFTKAKIWTQFGDTYTNSKLGISIADDTQLLQDRLTIDSTGKQNIIVSTREAQLIETKSNTSESCHTTWKSFTGKQTSFGIDGNNYLNIEAGATILNSNSTNSLILTNGGEEKIRMKANGNLGINVNNPLEKLDIKGTALFRNGGEVNGQINMGQDNNYVHSIKSRHNSKNAIDFYIWDSDSTLSPTTLATKNMLSITNIGLGIGTTDPSVLLDLGDNQSTQLIGLLNQRENGFWGFGATNNATHYFSGLNSDHIFYTNATTGTLSQEQEVVRIASDGNVGIGTNVTESSKFRVFNGESGPVILALKNQDVEAKLQVTQTDTNAMELFMGREIDWNVIFSNADSNDRGNSFSINNANDSVFFINKENLVSIGSSVGSSALSVFGESTTLDGTVSIIPKTSGAQTSLGIYRNNDSSKTESGDLWSINMNSPGTTDRHLNFSAYSIDEIDNYVHTMTLSPDNNVGIGVTDPIFKLHSSGDICINGTNNTSFFVRANNLTNSAKASIYFANANNTSPYEYNKTAFISTTTGLYFALNDANDPINADIIDTKLSLLQNGNVGIGTATPQVGFDNYNVSVFRNTVEFQSPLSLTNSTNSVNGSVGGALTVAGGMSVQRDVYLNRVRVLSTEESVTINTGSIITGGGVSIRAIRDAANVVNGGALTVSGGAAIAKKSFFGDHMHLQKQLRFYNNIEESLINMYDTNFNQRWAIGKLSSTGDFYIKRHNYLTGEPLESSIFIESVTGKFTFNNTTVSDSLGGAVNFRGGVTIHSTAQSASVSDGGSLTVLGGVSITKNVYIGQDTFLMSQTESVDPYTGALQVHGGVGIQGNMNVLGNTVITGNLTVQGTTTSVNSTAVSLKDNIMMLNAGPMGSADSGIFIQRYQFENDNNAGDIIQDTTFIQYQLQLQTGMSSSQIKLPTSATGDFTGWWIKVNSGLCAGQVRQILTYNASNKIATLRTPWTNQNPSTSDIIYLYNRNYVGVLFDETNDRFVFGTSLNDPVSTGTVALTDTSDLQVNQLITTSTRISTGSTGSVVLSGGLTILNSTDSTNISNGGSFTTNGGVSIGKSLIVGNSLTVANKNISPSVGDIVQERTFTSIVNNIVNPTNVTGLSFDILSTRGFDIYLSVVVSAANNLYANYHIRGINKDTSFEIVSTYVGDETGIEFSVTSLGQIQYTCSDYPSFVNTIMKFKAITTNV